MSAQTPGPWSIDAAGDVESQAVRRIAVVCTAATQDGWSGSDFATEARQRANARLIAEAGTVAHETGLTPRQLAEQRAELLEVVKKFIAWSEAEEDHKGTTFWERVEMLRDLDDAAAAAIAKAEGAAQ